MSKQTKSKSKSKKAAPAKKKVAKTAKASKVQAAEKEVKKVEKEAKRVEKEVEEEVQKEAKKVKTAVERKAPKPAPAPTNLGAAPDVTISSRHMDSMHERPGRGFSFGELESAGVPLNAAKREGLRVDVRRRSVIEGNVEALKAWYQTPAAA